MAQNDHDFARAFAPLMEVKQGGRMRPATPNDVLELIESGGRRYLLRGDDGRYLAQTNGGWSKRQKDAIVIPDRALARKAKKQGEQHDIRVTVVRLRRPGTCGIEAVRLRQDLRVGVSGDNVTIDISQAEAMDLLSALTAAKGSADLQ